MPRLTDDEVRAALAEGMPGWEHDGGAIRSLTTHDEGGVTGADIALARAIGSVATPPETHEA